MSGLGFGLVMVATPLVVNQPDTMAGALVQALLAASLFGGFMGYAAWRRMPVEMKALSLRDRAQVLRAIDAGSAVEDPTLFAAVVAQAETSRKMLRTGGVRGWWTTLTLSVVSVGSAALAVATWRGEALLSGLGTVLLVLIAILTAVQAVLSRTARWQPDAVLARIDEAERRVRGTVAAPAESPS